MAWPKNNSSNNNKNKKNNNNNAPLLWLLLLGYNIKWHRRHTLGLAFVFRIGLAIGFAPLGSDAGLVWCAVLWCGVVRLLGNLTQQLISTPGSTRTCVHGKWLGNNSKRASFAAKEKMHKYCF